MEGCVDVDERGRGGAERAVGRREKTRERGTRSRGGGEREREKMGSKQSSQDQESTRKES